MHIPRNKSEYIRVLKLAATPSSDDFLRISGIAALGISIVGAIGFVVFLLMQLLPA